MRQPIRILHILSELRHSGMEAMLVSAAPHFIEQGVVSDILATGAELGRFAPRLQRAGYTVRHVPFARSPLFLWRAYQAMRGGYGAIHIHTEGAGFWLGMAARLAGVPSVVRTIHGAFAFEGALRWRRLIQRQALRWLGIRHVAIGSSVQDNERRRFLLPTTRINNWYDDQRFTPTTGAQRRAARAALEIAADTATLVSIGNCGRVKNHRAILEALSMLPVEKRPLYLHVGAEEADEPERRLAQSLGVTAWVRFLGAQDDVCQALQAADLFIMPSLHEGLGNAALEALATGLPCILADVPGLRDFQKDFPGILYTKPDPMPVADAIVRAFDGLAELRQLAAHAHPRAALSGFSAKKGVADYAALYRAPSR